MYEQRSLFDLSDKDKEMITLIVIIIFVFLLGYSFIGVFKRSGKITDKDIKTAEMLCKEHEGARDISYHKGLRITCQDGYSIRNYMRD